MMKLQQKTSGTLRSREGALWFHVVGDYILMVKKNGMPVFTPLPKVFRGRPFCRSQKSLNSNFVSSILPVQDPLPSSLFLISKTQFASPFDLHEISLPRTLIPNAPSMIPASNPAVP